CLVALLCLLVSFFFCMLCRPLASTLFPYTTLFRSGGAMFFFGPVIGSVIFILFAVALSEFTPAWQFYLGIFFILMVMYAPGGVRSEEHTSELQSRENLVCRLLLEKENKQDTTIHKT